jgi:hypothetical protein
MGCQHMFVVMTVTGSNMFPLRFRSQLASRSDFGLSSEKPAKIDRESC